ncbi:MAG: hypothetical protein IH987_03745 [Planctomycetes bacterium]|nr:hypothetical protein [Planctomycetota bacterium]
MTTNSLFDGCQASEARAARQASCEAKACPYACRADDEDMDPLRGNDGTHDYLVASGRDWSVTNQQRDQGRVGVRQPCYWDRRIRDAENDYRN